MKASVAELAKALTDRILTASGRQGEDVLCQRAQLMLKDADKKEINMGGRNRESLLNCIVGTLYEYRVKAKKPRQKGD